MKKFIIFIFAILATVAPANAVNIEAMRGKVTDGYNFWFYEPENSLLARDGKPLVIFLHGQSLCGNDLNKVKRYGTISALEKGLDLDAFVIAPQNPGGSWKPSKIMNVVDWALMNYNIDPTRIYVLGMSLGGYGTIDLAAAYPDRIAAAIGMCGGATQKDLSGLANVPMWIIHGTGDAAVSVSASDKVVDAIKKAQTAGDGINRLHYDRIPGMNHSTPARVFYRAEAYDWLMCHSLEDPARPLTPTPKANSDFFNNAYKSLRKK